VLVSISGKQADDVCENDRGIRAGRNSKNVLRGRLVVVYHVARQRTSRRTRIARETSSYFIGIKRPDSRGTSSKLKRPKDLCVFHQLIDQLRCCKSATGDPSSLLGC
jgi:hypothetical protein